ncbi:Zn(II)2Cys6 transcription factor [Aspergillus undulatus]|uniref:Zn(II)2Cys6 transcription factor n=1 Tax=Aspergillus undulatus TaxID=1810928 RepID=UPI003CCDA152
MGNTNPDKRRVVNACTRCRQHKIKCSGDSPCTTCVLRKVRCKFEGEETKVHITKKHFSALKRRNLQLEEENRVLQQRLAALPCVVPADSDCSPTSPVSHVSADEAGALPAGLDDDDSPMVNPLSCGPPKYITDMAGRPHYLGHTSNWSLTVRLLHLTHHALYRCPFPSAAHHIDTMTYSLNWNGLRSSVVPDIRGLPSLDHALFLVNATKFHTGNIFHLFHESRFMAQLHHFYDNPTQYLGSGNLWFIHFLVIIALGKAFIGEKNRGTTPPGAEYFTRAFIMLPDYGFLWKDPCTSAELLCSMALYLQSIDWRTSAHNLIGQALRILQVHGYHTNVSAVTANKDLERCQEIWWTVYVLERQISVLLGVPLAISDNDISASLPNNLESVNKPMIVRIHVKLSQAFSQVVNALYKDTRELNSTLVKTAQEVLQRLAEAASELREHFPVPEQESLSGISRVSGYLNLLYHQCILLATRPFLFGLVEASIASECKDRKVPVPIQLLLQICLESTRKIVFILDSLQKQTLLECFLPWDLESAVSAGLVINMASLVCPTLIENHTHLLETLSSILDHIIEKGNLVAADQKTELNELGRICAELKASPAIAHYPEFSQAQDPIDSNVELELNPIMEVVRTDVPSAEATTKELFAGHAEASDWARDMTPSQLLEVVDMLNGDVMLDWMEFPSNSFI